jgi:hypothetical protein
VPAGPRAGRVENGELLIAGQDIHEALSGTGEVRDRVPPVSVTVPVIEQVVPAGTAEPQGPASAAGAPIARDPAVRTEAAKTASPLARSMRRINITYP